MFSVKMKRYIQPGYKWIFRTLLLAGLLTAGQFSRAQMPASSDDLFKAARQAAFEEKNYNKAKQLASQALVQSPHYVDIGIFLGRVYTWNKQYDSAVYYFQQVRSYAPAYEDAAVAYTDLEYWNDHYDTALSICNNGLMANPASADLLLRKAKILKALKQYKEAIEVTNLLLKLNKRNAEALALAASLKDAAAVNKIGINYEYSHFDKQFNEPWHLASISYSRYTKMGSISANVNYANRFGSNGWQGELEAYPHISKTFYSYVSFGYSPGNSVFPKYRAGFSLYANLPLSFEAEAGFRYLNFGSSTFVYTLYAGKYYKNFLFGLRSYVTPGGGSVSQSYSVMARYYFATSDDYLGINVGSGVSPDDRVTNVLYNAKNKLSSRQASASFNHRLAKMNIISLRAGWINQQYQTDKRGNQINISAGFQRRF